MMKNGVRPVELDKRDEKFHKHYGVVRLGGVAAVGSGLPDFDLGAHIENPDQNVDNAPTECTGYTQAHNAGDEDGCIYSKDFSYAAAFMISGEAPSTAGADIRDSLKGVVALGLLRQEAAPFTAKEKGELFCANWTNWKAIAFKALPNVRARYWSVLGAGDPWDSILSAMWLKYQLAQQEGKKAAGGMSIVSPWYPEWSGAGSDGLVPDADMTVNPLQMNWHNWTIEAKVTIGGIEYVKALTWQGDGFGDKGYSYYTRAQINAIFSIPRTGAFTTAKKGNRMWSLICIIFEKIGRLDLLPQLYLSLQQNQ